MTYQNMTTKMIKCQDGPTAISTVVGTKSQRQHPKSSLGSKHGALRPQKSLGLIGDGEVGGSGIYISNTYSLHCHHQNDFCIKVGSCVSHFNVALIVWAKSQNSVHKPQFLKGKESLSGSNRGPSAYQPCALPLGHTASQGSLVAYIHIYIYTLHVRQTRQHRCVQEYNRNYFYSRPGIVLRSRNQLNI